MILHKYMTIKTKTKTKTNLSILSLALITSTTVLAGITEPSFTVESAIHTYKINADATYELTEEVITRINTQQTANDAPDDQLPYNFDHIITYLLKWDLYADSTIGLAPFGQLSNVELGKPTVPTALNKIGHTKKFTVADEQIIDDTSMQIQADGAIKGTTETHFKGTKEITARNTFSGFEGEEKKRDRSSCQISWKWHRHLYPSDVYDLTKPFTVSGTFTLNPISNIPGNGAITLPIGLAKGAITYKGEIRPEETAEFPFICQAYYLEENTQLKFPSNVIVTKIPVSVSCVANGINYQSPYTLKDNAVTAKRSLGVDSHQSFVAAKI